MGTDRMAVQQFVIAILHNSRRHEAFRFDDQSVRIGSGPRLAIPAKATHPIAGAQLKLIQLRMDKWLLIVHGRAKGSGGVRVRSALCQGVCGPAAADEPEDQCRANPGAPHAMSTVRNIPVSM